MSDTMTKARPAEGVTDAINRTAVEVLSASEPEWLQQRRLEAWEIYAGMPWPSTRLEEWRYTNVSRALDVDALRLAVDPDLPDDRAAMPAGLIDAMDEDRDATGHLIEVDGHVVHTDLVEDLAGKGVVLSSLRNALRDRPELLEEHLANRVVPATEGKFQALNAALWTDGVLLYVPRGVRLELPVRVTRWVTGGGMAALSRTLIVAEEGSQVSFVDEVLSEDLDAQSLVSSAVEVVAHDNAQVQYVSLQRLGRGAFHQSAQRTFATRDATLDTLNVSLGASVSRVDLNTRLLGPGASSDMLGLYFGDADQHFDHNTSQDHIADHASSDLLYKGALDGSSRSVFRGVIRVHPGAQGTDAYQTNRNLLLSNTARADSLPNLQLDEEALFYLMSRGLGKAQAERLVVLGFLGEVLSRLPLGGVVEKVTGVIEQKLAQV
jgi:Fe-S cluster assembly protein SufD